VKHSDLTIRQHRSCILGHFPISALFQAIPRVSPQLTKLRRSIAGATNYHLPIWAQKQEILDMWSMA